MAFSSVERRNQHTAKSELEEYSSTYGSDDDKQGANEGWADSIAKVLSSTKPRTKKILVLSRAKKSDTDSKKKNESGYGFEVDGEIKDEKPTEEELEASLKQSKNQKLYLRVKPSWKDIDRERTLRKIATRGVIQLFNAVRMQQRDLHNQLEEAGPLDSRKEAVLNNINKRKFLDVLMSGKRSKSEQVDNLVKHEFVKEESDAKKTSEWSVLRADFMTNKKIKHWDEDDVSHEEKSDEDN